MRRTLSAVILLLFVPHLLARDMDEIEKRGSLRVLSVLSNQSDEFFSSKPGARCRRGPFPPPSRREE